jgi:hypothetical protein
MYRLYNDVNAGDLIFSILCKHYVSLQTFGKNPYAIKLWYFENIYPYFTLKVELILNKERDHYMHFLGMHTSRTDCEAPFWHQKWHEPEGIYKNACKHWNWNPKSQLL